MTANDHTTCASFYRHRAVERIKQIIALRRDSYEMNGRQGIDWMLNEAAFQEMRARDDFRQAARDEAAAMQRRAA